MFIQKNSSAEVTIITLVYQAPRRSLQTVCNLHRYVGSCDTTCGSTRRERSGEEERAGLSSGGPNGSFRWNICSEDL